MSRYRKKYNLPENYLHTCPTCRHKYTGDYCSNCGEKIFHKHDLSLAHILEEAIDKFTHLELKVPKSIVLLFNPGYLTDKFIHGVRKPFAHPIQLFIIANIIFFLCYKIVPFTDFTPSWGDNAYYGLSNYPIFKWAEPIDTKINDAFERKEDTKLNTAVVNIGFDYKKVKITDSTFQQQLDTASNPNLFIFKRLLTGDKTHFVIDKKYKQQLYSAYDKEMWQESANFSKSLIFLLILLVAPVIYLFFRKRFVYAGSVLIFSTHFVSFYILYFGFTELLIHYCHFSLATPFEFILDHSNKTIQNVITFFIGQPFEMSSLLAVITYLYFSFRRLIIPKWWINLIASYFIARIFFFFCFGVYKKIILWIAISMY